MSDEVARTAIEAVVRESYGRLIAFLAARSGDVAGAEDALSEAFLGALRTWPDEGVPEKPEAWLLHAARNRMIDDVRHRQVRQRVRPWLEQLVAETAASGAWREELPDERLKLLFVCAHPAIDPVARTPLMLQTVLGLETARIASAFLVSPAAMEKRLVRAKAKIRTAGIPFRVPEPAEWVERSAFVLDAVYSAYTAGWENVSEAAAGRGLAGEAMVLGRVLVRLMPEDPEARGLLALMLHCEARRGARRTSEGEFVPLDRQDPARWDRAMIEEAEEQLRRAAQVKRLGRFQLEAAIQSIHAHRAVTGRIEWREIALLYEGLVRVAPGIGAEIGRAVALAESGEVEVALARLDALAGERVASYQPYWAARGHVLELVGRAEEAREAFRRAAGLTEDAGWRGYLMGRVEGSHGGLEAEREG
jgi:Predicted RNA polymerase sigma factor containing a TPR repeat domain